MGDEQEGGRGEEVIVIIMLSKLEQTTYLLVYQ